MLLLILSIINWAFINNSLTKLLVALAIFIIVETKRKNKSATTPMIIAEFISAFILLALIISIVINIIH